jgi:hypothetical protein
VRRLTAIFHLAIAALLLMGAAICATAQSHAVKQNGGAAQPTAAPGKSVEATPQAQPPTAPAPSAAKQNTRAREALPAGKDAPLSLVRYTYEFTQPDFTIRHILISHDENGRGQITFERKNEDAAITDPLELSPAALVRVKALWDALRFMDSATEYQSERQFPHLGTMRLGMTRGERQRFVEFNWTNDTNASALVNEYRRAADQALFVFNISVARENQPLEAPKLLDELDKLYKRNGLSDPQQLVPLLSELVNDERLPLIARNHAGRLIKQIQK